MKGDSLCAFCSRFKRGLLYSCCRTNGYNKLVLAQHLDDLVESFLMSALHNGQVIESPWQPTVYSPQCVTYLSWMIIMVNSCLLVALLIIIWYLSFRLSRRCVRWKPTTQSRLVTYVSYDHWCTCAREAPVTSAKKCGYRSLMRTVPPVSKNRRSDLWAAVQLSYQYRWVLLAFCINYVLPILT